MHIHTYTYIDLGRLCIHAYTYIYMHIHAYTCIYIHLHHIHTYTYISDYLSGGVFEGVQPALTGLWTDSNQPDLM